MKLISLLCNHCGASLDVNEQTKFVTCNYCSSKLKVERSGNAVYTTLLKKVEGIQKDVKRLRLEQELMRLDTKWKSTEDSFRDESGHLPEASFAITLTVFIVIGLFLMMFGGINLSSSELVLPLVGASVLMIGILAWLYWRMHSYNKKKKAYHQSRLNIIRRMTRS